MSKMSLGIKKDLQAKAGIPIPAPKKVTENSPIFPHNWVYPVGKLVKVFYDPEKEITRNKEKVKEPVLCFVFTTQDGKQYTHIEFQLDQTDSKFDGKLVALQQRIKHFFEETVGENFFEEIEASTFEELFKGSADLFNKNTITRTKGEGENKKEQVIPLYALSTVYIKLTYYKDKLQFGLYPNLIQRASIEGKNQVCELMINPTHDKVEPVAKLEKKTGSYSGGTDGSYGAADDDFDGFPAVPVME